MGLKETLESFIKDSGVDARAADALRSEAEAVQRAVLDRGEMSECRNPSASLMARIKVAKDNLASRNRSPPRASSCRGHSGPSNTELDDFVKDNEIDESASRALREASPDTQRTVLERGGVTDCRNPSAVCLARIRDARDNRRSSSQQNVQTVGYSYSPAAGMMYGAYAAYGSQPVYAGGYGYFGQPMLAASYGAVQDGTPLGAYAAQGYRAAAYGGRYGPY